MSVDMIQKIISEKSRDPWWLESENKVIRKYGDIFNPRNLDNLTKEDFKSFLLIKNNLHWEGIHRQGNIITSDMDKLRKFLQALLNESTPIEERLEKLFDRKSSFSIKGFGKAVATAILLVVYPDRYGVWNTKSESALKTIHKFPDLKTGDTFADKYLKVNYALRELANQYQINLWQLDGVLGEISGFGPFGNTPSEEEIIETEAEEHGITDVANFGMERHLEDFLIDNWDKTIFGKDYKLLESEGSDIESQQYPTDVGPIDILVKSKDDKEYLVIELKKGKSSDAVVGQLQRYMGWVDKHLKKENESVKGLIILNETDDRLKYSLRMTKNIELMTYKVTFSLQNEKVE